MDLISTLHYASWQKCPSPWWQSYEPLKLLLMSRTVYVPILLLLLGVCVDASAQIQQPGTPLNWELKTIDRSAIPAITTPKLNMELIRAQDAITDQYKETPYLSLIHI